MALLTLKDIGKIYVSKGNVTVGIRGVNLSFDRGEFVAITGQSGSGKSTLLNVISGMDTYEEGELYIEGQPTSHYLQPEWEEYREKYISFIFQDYNIIESFTVLENVELALMHIEDTKERRRRAIELLDRVGMHSHLNHKGSKLSGGQKQRTVIARALAKDSPIILADEPTGNLDSETSREIVELLREVSRDKLLIVVTHDFEEVEFCATRHVRIFDGSVESDRIIDDNRNTIMGANEEQGSTRVKEKKPSNIKNGLRLGLAMFTARPKLSIFLCLLMIIGTLGVFLVTGTSGSVKTLFENNYMFSHIDGRVVFTKQSGQPIGSEDLKAISEKYGAQSYLHFDMLLDYDGSYVYFPSRNFDEYNEYVMFDFTYNKDYGDDIIGRYPESANEVFLSLPIGYKNKIGAERIERDKLVIDELEYDVVGVNYYADNNIPPECSFTEEGFRIATVTRYMMSYGSGSFVAGCVSDKDPNRNFSDNFFRLAPSFEIEKNKLYIDSDSMTDYVKNYPDDSFSYFVNVNFVYYNYDYYGGTSESLIFNRSYDDSDISFEEYEDLEREYGSSIYVSPYLLLDLVETVLENSYTQASLFFPDDEAAEEAAELMCNEGFIAVPSNTTYTPDAFTIIVNFLSAIFSLITLILTIVFLAFFINLCSARALDAFKGDMAIMRSMGIPVNTIKVGMYVRMLISLIPAYLVVIASAILIYLTPTFNAIFMYLYVWQYLIIFVGMLFLAYRVTKKQIGRLFNESVKKSLKGGEEQ